MYRSYYNRPRRAPRYPRYNFGGYYPSSNRYTHVYYYRNNRRRRQPYWHRDFERFLTRTMRYRGSDGSAVPEPPKPVEVPKPEPPKEKIAKALKVMSVDLNIEENTKRHHTNKYQCTRKRKDKDGKELPAELVVRRAQKITLTLTFDRPYDKKLNDAKIVFQKGIDPLPMKGTMAVIEMDETGKKTFDDDEWGASMVAKSGNSITVDVHIPANCIIGEWNLLVETYVEGGKDENNEDIRLVFKYEHDEDITILFNPWAKADTVYMPTEELLDEYILNDAGCYFSGSEWSPRESCWVFGQFEEGILEAALYIVRTGFGGKETQRMANPIAVSRVISSIVNAPDDNGVLVGNWSGNFEGGKAPWKWKSSVHILRKYMEKNVPVKFGQCWVFSTVTTTVCRAIGIPGRCITTFNSAHDTDESNAIEKIFCYDGNKITRTKHPSFSDSVWNFHCWNEVWMSRPDLEEGFDGWQVIDATPQERVEGVFQCGPTSKAAIKRGLCNLPYETGFVFSEVNADEVHYLMRDDGSFSFIKLKKDCIGNMIVTKKPDGKPFRFGFKHCLDVTNEYKFPEGTKAERQAVAMAQKTAVNPSPAYDVKIDEIKDVTFKLNHSNDLWYGDPLEITVVGKNSGPFERYIRQLQLTIAPQKYTGDQSVPIFEKTFPREDIKPNEEKSWTVKLEETDYFPKMKNSDEMYLTLELRWLVAKAQNRTEQVGSKSHIFRFKRPDLVLKAPEKTKLNEPVTIEVSFTNQLSSPLTKCDLSWEANGFKDELDVPMPDVPPKKEFKTTVQAVPLRPGLQTLAFTFDCKELPDLDGAISIDVHE